MSLRRSLIFFLRAHADAPLSRAAYTAPAGAGSTAEEDEACMGWGGGGPSGRLQ